MKYRRKQRRSPRPGERGVFYTGKPMAKYGRPIAEELEMESEQPKSSGVPFWRRWLVGIDILVYSLVCFQFIRWARNAFDATEGANAVLRYGCALVALIFDLICIPLLAYELAC